MAAGLGTRLRPFTDHAPKALLPIMGVPSAQFAIDALKKAGVEKIVANVHHHADAARTGLLQCDPQIFISDESRQLLGSAGGIKKALTPPGALLDSAPFFLLNADVLCDIDLEALGRTHQKLRAERGVLLTLALAPEGPAGGKYAEIITEPSGLIQKIGPHCSGRPFFIGAAVFEPEALAHVPFGVPAETIPLIFQPAIDAGRAGFHGVTGGYGIWKDIGSPSLWLDAHLEIIERLETGRLPGSWRKRMEAVSERVSNGVWIGKRARRPRSPFSFSGPCFWDGQGLMPKSLGARAVLYGETKDPDLRNGIGFEGAWVQGANL